MIIELKQVFDIVDESIDIDYSMDLSQYELFDDKPFITPVYVKGAVLNHAGVVTLKYFIRFSLKLHCDRCLEVFEREFEFSFEEILVTSLNTDSDEYILIEDYKLLLDEIVLSDILLSLPSKLLCSEDCMGLCYKCGANLNQTSCLCKQTEVDPRLSILSQLLVEDDDQGQLIK